MNNDADRRIWTFMYYGSPQSVQQGANTLAQYLARAAGQPGPSFQSNMVQGVTYGSNTGNGQRNFPGNNYGADYFQDGYGYQDGKAPVMAPTEPVTYGAGKWVNGKYVAQPLPSTNWDTRQVPQPQVHGSGGTTQQAVPGGAVWDQSNWDQSNWQ